MLSLHKLKSLSLKEQQLKDLQKKDFIFQKSPSNTREFLNNFLTKEKIEIIPKYDVVGKFSISKSTVPFLSNFIKSDVKWFVIETFMRRTYEYRFKPLFIISHSCQTRQYY